jgi:hypothetical protein
VSHKKYSAAENVSQANSTDRNQSVSGSTRNDWQAVDCLEFLATTVDLRVVLFHVQEPSIPT